MTTFNACSVVAANGSESVPGKERRCNQSRQRASIPLPASSWPQLLSPETDPSPGSQASEFIDQ